MEYAVIPNDEKNDEDSLASDIDPPQTIFWKLKEWIEWAMKLTETGRSPAESCHHWSGYTWKSDKTVFQMAFR